MRTFIHFSALDSALCLWWEQPAEAMRNAVYTVLLDGRPVAEVNRTHVTVEHLAPGTSYDVQVCLGGELIGETAAKTAAVKKPMDVTLPRRGRRADPEHRRAPGRDRRLRAGSGGVPPRGRVPHGRAAAAQ